MRQQYRKKADQFIFAVQLNLDTEGLTYQKWGVTQKAKPCDWLVKNDDETYTIDNDVFKKTYRHMGDGKYIKTTSIWAEKVSDAGSIKTKEGRSFYKAGDYIVSNCKDGSHSYCISADKFNAMYELV